MTDYRYPDPQALRQAITDRLRVYARDHPGELADLRRQVAYDRLLSRLFLAEPERWILKGATALLARLGGRARHSLDVDLASDSKDLEEAEAAFTKAAAVDLGDFFRFAGSPGIQLIQSGRVRRIPVVAYLGVTEFASFHVDIVIGHPLTGKPDQVPALVPIEVPGWSQVGYRVYPVVDHVADKVCALIERHPRGDGRFDPSTRYRDLADLVVFARTAEIDARELQAALEAESARRALTLPASLPKPDGPGWIAGYARIAREVPGILERDLDTAIVTARNFLDPLLQGRRSGRWDQQNQRWSDDDTAKKD